MDDHVCMARPERRMIALWYTYKRTERTVWIRTKEWIVTSLMSGTAATRRSLDRTPKYMFVKHMSVPTSRPTATDRMENCLMAATGAGLGCALGLQRTAPGMMRSIAHVSPGIEAPPA